MGLASLIDFLSSIKHLEEMRAYASEVPVVNQIELHPWNSASLARWRAPWQS